MLPRYHLQIPISAILDKPDGDQVRVTIPTGAVLLQEASRSTTLLGMVGVYWQGRHYSVSVPELLLKAQRLDADVTARPPDH